MDEEKEVRSFAKKHFSMISERREGDEIITEITEGKEEANAFLAFKKSAENHMVDGCKCWLESAIRNYEDVLVEVTKAGHKVHHIRYFMERYFRGTEHEVLVLSICNTLEQVNRRMVEGQFRKLDKNIKKWKLQENGGRGSDARWSDQGSIDARCLIYRAWLKKSQTGTFNKSQFALELWGREDIESYYKNPQSIEGLFRSWKKGKKIPSC